MRGDVGSNPAQGEFSFKHLFSLNMIIWGVQGQGFSHILYIYIYIYIYIYWGYGHFKAGAKGRGD